MWHYLGQSPRNGIVCIPVPLPIAFHFSNDTEGVAHFSICEDKKLNTEDIGQVSMKFTFFFFFKFTSKIPQFALEKLDYFMPETLMPLQTRVTSPVGHCPSFSHGLHFHHPTSFTSGFCGIPQESFHLHSSEHGAKEEEFYGMPLVFSPLPQDRQL